MLVNCIDATSAGARLRAAAGRPVESDQQLKGRIRDIEPFARACVKARLASLDAEPTLYLTRLLSTVLRRRVQLAFWDLEPPVDADDRASFVLYLQLQRNFLTEGVERASDADEIASTLAAFLDEIQGYLLAYGLVGSSYRLAEGCRAASRKFHTNRQDWSTGGAEPSWTSQPADLGTIAHRAVIA